MDDDQLEALLKSVAPCPRPWPEPCVMVLALILRMGDSRKLRMWMRLHIDGSEASWNLYASVLASFSSSQILEAVRSRYGQVPALVVPMADENASPAIRDAVRIVTMHMNRDRDGIAGVLRAWKDERKLDEVIGALASMASSALSSPIEETGKG